jgi:hypothetical protein
MKKIFSFLLVFLWVSSAPALTADDMSKEVNKQIRHAEQVYFKGKAQEASSLLQEAETSLIKLKSQDPNHRSLKSLQTKYDRLKAKVDKKLAKSSASESSAAAPAAKSALSQKLSHGAKSNLKKADREMNFAERELAKGEKSLQAKQFNLVESYIFNTRSKLDSVNTLLNKVVNNNKASPDHPDVAAAFQRHQDLEQQLTAFSNKAQGKEKDVKQAATQSKEKNAALNKQWLPKISPFIEVSSKSRVQYPGSYNQEELARQEKLYAQAKTVLENVNNDVPKANQPHELKNAVEKLDFSLQVYADEKKADTRNRLQPIQNTLLNWTKRLEQNSQWNEQSDLGLYVITQKKLDYQKNQITELSKIYPEEANGFTQELQLIEKENKVWMEKKSRWMERPRPFPQARMKSSKLQNEMKALLEDRAIQVIELVITDKDWWVQRGEFRYLATAVLSKDDKGQFWSRVSFRQLKTLTGYGPTEVWDIDEIRIRLP